MQIDIAEIKVGKRLRRFREDIAEQLARSIGEIGLLHPIVVCTRSIHNPQGGADIFVFELVAGLHRLRACERLGKEKIEATVIAPYDRAARLGQIDENLCSAQLTQLERAEHLFERKRIYEEMHPDSVIGGDRRSADFRTTNCRSETFAQDAAQKTGSTARSIQRAIRRAAKIDWRLRKRLRELPTVADSAAELDMLVKMDHGEQKCAVALVETGQAATIREAEQLMRSNSLSTATGTAPSSFDGRWKSFLAVWQNADSDQRFIVMTTLWDDLDALTKRRMQMRICERVPLAS
jgi:ParB family transcriptional regulator, chromosome partitioning protein